MDQTFAAPHFYKADEQRSFIIADQEYEELFQYSDEPNQIEAETLRKQAFGKYPIVGRVTFASGERQEFTDPEKYLQVVHEELLFQATTGFRCETLTDDPEIRKAVDDMVCDLYGEENPRQIEDYGSIGMTMGGSMQ